MAQSTPLRPLATLDAVTFFFAPARSANVAVHFFDSGGALLPPGGSLDVTGVLPQAMAAGPTSDPTPLPSVEYVPATPTTTIPGGEFRVFDLGSGAGSLKLTPSALVAPGGATSYTISCARAQARAPE